MKAPERYKFWTLLLAAHFVCCLHLAAQVKATQGESEVERFDSPMLLEFPIALNSPDKWVTGQTIRPKTSLSGYSCEGVSIVSFFAEATKRRDHVRFTIHVIMKNEPGHDKLVNVRLEPTLNGEPIAGAVWLRRVDVEEGKPPKHTSVQINVPLSNLDADGTDILMKLRLEAIDH